MTKQILRTDKFLIRENKGQYYVYSIEKGEGRKVIYRYVGPLAKILDFYLSSGGVGVSPTVRPPGFEPGISGLGGQRP
ncbi:MAG: putative integrase, partial [Candidatus Micrarchaeaceae archaeon]